MEVEISHESSLQFEKYKFASLGCVCQRHRASLHVTACLVRVSAGPCPACGVSHSRAAHPPTAAKEHSAPASPAGSCQLNSPRGKIKHVVTIIFDNTHFQRDPARDGSTLVPSDLEQMPHLLNFLKNNGVLLSNHHTQLISHTSDDIITILTGVYPAATGWPPPPTATWNTRRMALPRLSPVRLHLLD